jgi:hypothetical protein
MWNFIKKLLFTKANPSSSSPNSSHPTESSVKRNDRYAKLADFYTKTVPAAVNTNKEYLTERVPYRYSRTTRIAGVTFQNEDGTSRQTLIQKLRVGDTVYLEREYLNNHSKYAVIVLNEEKQALGYIPKEEGAVGYSIDEGYCYDCVVDSLPIVGDPPKNACVIRYYQNPIDPSKKRQRQKYIRWKEGISKKLLELRVLEINNIDTAIDGYNEVIAEILSKEREDLMYWVARSFHMPIDRLTILLEKKKLYQEGIEKIEWYIEYQDAVKLKESDLLSLLKRQERLIKKSPK